VPLPRLNDVQLDRLVLIFATAISLGSSLVFGRRGLGDAPDGGSLRNGFHGVPLDPLEAAYGDRRYSENEPARVKASSGAL
jgi:hypothetical protein